MSSLAYDDILAQIANSQWYQQQVAAPPAAAPPPEEVAPTSYVPGTDVPIEPGFYNPTNPYDTGRQGESNTEILRGQGKEAEKVPGWDYENRRWKPGYSASNPGFGDPAVDSANNWGQGSAGTGQTPSFMPATNFAAGAGGGPPPAPLQRNPQLPQHPLGAFSDARYEAETAMLRSDIMKAYNDILSQLGYQDDKGGFVKGTVEIDADRKRRDMERGSTLAGEEVTKQSQREGTLFSGIRGTNTARAQHPFIQGIADLEVDTPRMLGSLYGKAMGTLDDYTRRQNLLIAEASERAAQRAMMNRRSGGGGGGTTTTTTAGAPGVDPNAPLGVLGAGGQSSPLDALLWATAAGFEWGGQGWVPQTQPTSDYRIGHTT